MGNFYTDNPDIAFVLDHLDLDSMVALRERDFSEADTYDYAPRSVEEAKEQYHDLLKLAGEICADVVAPRAKIVDKEGNICRDGAVILHPELEASVKAFSDADLMGLSIDRRFGGMNIPQPVKVGLVEMVSRADASVMNIVGLQDIAETVEECADEEICHEVLPRMCSGEHTGAMVLTEADAGSDLQRVRLRAEPANGDGEKGEWRLNGAKRFITNGCGDVLLVLARSEPDTTDARGLSVVLAYKGRDVYIRRIEDKLGIHGSPTCEIQFNNAPGRLIGRRRRGLIDVAMNIMNGARLGIATQALGIAEAAAREATDYARTREQFGKTIRNMPAVYEMLAQMRLRIEASRVLCYTTAEAVEEQKMLEKIARDNLPPVEDQKNRLRRVKRLAAVLTPLAKYYATEAANQVASDAIQVLGGSGYMKDYPVERHFRDARITNIYEGTSQLQVVGAMPGLLAGTLTPYIQSMLEKAKATSAKPMAEDIEKLMPLFEQSIAVFKEKRDQEFTDLFGRLLVEMACDIYCGTVMTLHAGTAGDFAEHKTAVAEAFIATIEPRVQCHAAQIHRGDRTLLEKNAAIIGC